MTDKLIKIAKTLHPARLTSLAYYLLRDEAISGKLIIGAVVLALIAANTSLASTYEALWQTQFSVGLGDWSLSLDLRHWISDALMALFFLVVGLELSRELDRGELRNRRTAALPFAAAIGGMLVPGLIYVAVNFGNDSLSGWAIPTTTDIALAVGILALLARRIPSSIRIFLLTLAIIDDIAAVIIIAVFFAAGIKVALLLLAAAIVLLMYVLRNSKLMTMPLYILTGVILWLIVYHSGLHASITGAVLGLLAPLALSERNEVSIAERLERAVIPISTLAIVPLFAFANTGVALSFESFKGGSAIPIAAGIIIGLVAGKVLGIIGGTWLMVRWGGASLPSHSNWNHIIGVGMLAGIGFTLSIFVTELAFTNEEYINISKMSIFVASVLSACIGYFALRFTNARTGNIEIDN